MATCANLQSFNPTGSTPKHIFSANPRLVVGLFETPFQSFELQAKQATYMLFSGFAI